MPITDNDLVTVRKATRDGSTNIQVEFKWIDGVTGEDKGVFVSSWSTAAEFKAWLEDQSPEELKRAFLLQCLNRDTGALRASVFDALAGKQFRVQQRVQQV